MQMDIFGCKMPLIATDVQKTIIELCFHSSGFVISFAEEDYSYKEGDPDAQVCLIGEGEITTEAAATVSSVPSGTAQGQ